MTALKSDGRTRFGATKRLSTIAALMGSVLLVDCMGESPSGLDSERTFESGRCSLDAAYIMGVVPPGFIPALTLPIMVGADAPPTSAETAGYLSDSDRVLGIVLNGEARAYPHKILKQHEIVNDRVGDTWVSVTYCPLTGSGLVFDPHIDGQRLDLGVSGLLFANNLVMYDRASGAIYGPQLSVEGRCDVFRGESLAVFPVQEMSWGRWKHFHPDTKVIGVRAQDDRYLEDPYRGYDDIDNYDIWYPGPVDTSRPPKERVLAVRVGDGGRGYPFGELAALGETSVVNEVVGEIPTVILYEAAFGENAVAFDARVDGEALEWEVAGIGIWADVQTGSRWTIEGVAFDGPLKGTVLEPRADAYVAFWFAWRHFQPEGTPFLG